MIALFISNDPSIFMRDSAARERMRRYAEAIGELHVVSSAPRGAERTREGGLTLYPIAPGAFRLVRQLRVARRVARECRAEVVSSQDPFEHGLIARIVARACRAGFHVQVHTDFLSPHFLAGSIKNRIRALMADRILIRADAIRVVSVRIAKDLVARYGTRIKEPSVLPIAPGIHPDAPVALPPHEFSFVCLYVGRLEREKRAQDVVEAVKEARKKHSSVGLFIAGLGREERRLKALVRREHLTDVVIFLGERPDVLGLMRSAHALVQASAYEGYGRTLLEAAIARLPIISTEVGVIGSVLMPEREVLAAPVADTYSLARQLLRLVEDEQLRRALIVNAEAAALAHLAPLQSLPELVAEDLLRALGAPGNQGGVG